jgi:hypothetical protein
LAHGRLQGASTQRRRGEATKPEKEQALFVFANRKEESPSCYCGEGKTREFFTKRPPSATDCKKKPLGKLFVKKDPLSMAASLTN